MKGVFDELRAQKRGKLIAAIAAAMCAIVIILYYGSNEKRKETHSLGSPVSANGKRVTDATGFTETRRRDKVESGNSSQDRSDNIKRINITNFESNDFDAAWAEAVRAGRTEVDQVYNLLLVVGRMSRIAEPNQILEKILEGFGPGRSRCQLIGSLFMGSDRVKDLEATYRRLEFPDELSAACSGISHNLSMLDSPDSIDRSKYAFLGDRFDEVLQKSLELYVSRFLSKPSVALSAAVTQALAVESSMDGKMNLISRLTKIAPFDCWEQVIANKLDISASDQKAMFSLMFARDATVAMERIAAVPGSEKYFPAAFQLWLENDARRPIEWLENNKQNLSPAQRESAMQGIAEYSARQGDCETAWKWVAQITDPTLRKQAEGRVWSKERGMVSQEVGKNPEATVQSMINGNSLHQDYWLEEAMATWIAKDPAKAQDWYQKNWNSIPANKSQYLAAAIAKQALNQGDAASASQWAALIQDPKTKQRIQDRINKAGTDHKK